MRNNKGISLIVLIVTIVVIIILSAVVVLTINKNNPIESAKEARFKEDIRTFQYELVLAVSKNVTTEDKKFEKVTELEFDKIKEYISSFSEKYRDKIVIQDNELRYTDKIDEKEKEWLKELNIAKAKSLLSDGYTELEYIESTGAQYIDTNYIVNSTNLQNIDFEIRTSIDDYTSISSMYDGRICGASSGLESYIGAYYDSSGNITVMKRVKREVQDNAIKVAEGNNTLISLIGYKVYKDNILQGEITSTPISINNFSKSFLLFAYNTSSIQIAKYNLKIYSFKLWDDNVLVRNMIPCYRNLDNKPGMYDSVNKVFYVNSGTGEFLYKEKE